MTDKNNPIYYEECNKKTMTYVPFFLEKLKKIQHITKSINFDGKTIQSIIIPNNCQQCQNKKFYKLGNIVWSNSVKHKIQSHQSYPSEYFIKIILNTSIVNDYIVNPPIEILPDQINKFSYIPLHYNKLLIIDALMNQGSYPRYLIEASKENPKDKFIYSEHSGVISVKNNIIDNIIVSTETNRVDANDSNIYLPVNIENLSKYEYLFHTHPNTSSYGGRVGEGIIYEFPSANDLFNFVKFRNEGKAQASVVIAPEGIYVIRPIKYDSKHKIDSNLYYSLRKFILKLEKMAIKKIKPIIKKISYADVFHQKIGSNFSYIKMFNKFIEPTNLLIEYYPRERRNGEWCLRQINLQYMEI